LLLLLLLLFIYILKRERSQSIVSTASLIIKAHEKKKSTFETLKKKGAKKKKLSEASFSPVFFRRLFVVSRMATALAFDVNDVNDAETREEDEPARSSSLTPFSIVDMAFFVAKFFSSVVFVPTQNNRIKNRRPRHDLCNRRRSVGGRLPRKQHNRMLKKND